jgi:hypothetical protein
MVKPELAAAAGSWAYHEDRKCLVPDSSVAVVGAAAGRPERLLATNIGTSFAAPLVSNIAARVVHRYPDLSSNAVRALVLISVKELPLPLLGSSPIQLRRAAERLTGYGEPDARRAESSDDHRAVLVADTAIGLDEVHIYRVSIPPSFNEAGGWRKIAVALAFNPPVRPSRLDYLGSEMQFQVFRGLSVPEVRRAYMADQQLDGGTESGAPPESIRANRLDLQPAATVRGRGANQFGSYTLLKPVRTSGELVVAVRNTNKWDVPGRSQPYAIAVMLQRDDNYRAIYHDIRIQLEVEATQEIELEG